MHQYRVTVDGVDYEVAIAPSDIDLRDYDSYQQCLEKILEQSQKEYWSNYVDINRHQIIVGRNALWVSAAIIGALSTLYVSYHSSIEALSFIGSLFYLAAAPAVVAFGVCLYAMPARSGLKTVYQKSWVDYSNLAYKNLENLKANSYPSFLSKLITDTESANMVNINTLSKRGRLFRITSWLLVWSFCIAILDGLAFISNSTLEMECSMSDLTLFKYAECIYEQR